MRRLIVASLVVISAPLALGPASAQPLGPDLGVLVSAHGASDPWNAPVVSAAECVRRSLPAAVGFLMGKGSTPQQAYDAIVQRVVEHFAKVVPQA